MALSTGQKTTIDTTKKRKVSITMQLVLLASIVLWTLIIIRVGVGVTEKAFIDWAFDVLFWTMIIVAGLLLVELMFLVILMLFWLGFITGVPTIGVI